MVISYAQNFEDIMLWRALKHVERGFYIDVGAQDPVTDSVSLAFYEQRWRGVHVEPVAQFARKLRDARPDEVVIEAAIGHHDATIPFFEICDTGLSTGDEMIARAHETAGHTVRRIDVSSLPLGKILDTYKGRDIHWLKIDVEGMEREVIESWSPSTVRPWIVLVESTKPASIELSFAGWESLLLQLGYEFAYFDGLNRFYVSQQHANLKASFGAGPNVFDGFVLSGLSSAPFCRKLVGEISGLGQMLDATRAGADAERTAFAHAASAWKSASEAMATELTRKNETLIARETEISTLTASKLEAIEEHERIAEELLRKDEALTARVAEIAHKNQALSACESQIVDFHGRIAEMSLALDEKHSELLSSKAAADHLNEQLGAVYRSRSWLATRPLRQVSHVVTLARGLAPKLPAILARRCAVMVQQNAPRLYARISTSRPWRRLYSTIAGPHVLRGQSQPSNHLANAGATPAQHRTADTNSLKYLTTAMQGWSSSKRVDE